MSWVMKSAAMRSWSIMPKYHWWISRFVRASRAEKGSSSSAASRDPRKVRSRAARWRIPPESWAGYLSSVPSRPKRGK